MRPSEAKVNLPSKRPCDGKSHETRGKLRSSRALVGYAMLCYFYSVLFCLFSLAFYSWHDSDDDDEWAAPGMAGVDFQRQAIRSVNQRQ